MYLLLLILRVILWAILTLGGVLKVRESLQAVGKRMNGAVTDQEAINIFTSDAT